MAVILASDDLDFLRQVRDLGLSGKTQTEIAEALGFTLGSLRFRLSRLGFELMPANDVRAILTKRSLGEMLESGEIQPGSAEPVVVAA